MQMTNDEIKTSYRDAKCKSKQIPILAQLNACDTTQIREILGLNNSKNKDTSEMTKEEASVLKTLEISKLYHQGFDDLQISKMLNIDRHTVATWRNSLGLRTNKYKRKIKYKSMYIS